jgi:hypothetical protein
MCKSNYFMCTIENNYMYNSTCNCFLRFMTQKIKRIKLKKECYLKINLNVPQKQFYVYHRRQLHVL